MFVDVVCLSGTRSKLNLLNKAIKGVTFVEHVKALLIRLYTSFRFLSLAYPSNVISNKSKGAIFISHSQSPWNTI